MKQFLLFRLYAPLASFGDIAVGERRQSYSHPSKSAIVGLIAAAFGITREEQDRINNLHTALGYAVRVEHLHSQQMADYHTTQTLEGRTIPLHVRTRKDELANKQTLGTVLSTRWYLQDALFSLCLWLRSNNTEFSLTNIEEALKRPTFTLYAGRKSCPLALPLKPQIVNAETVKDAFEKFTLTDKERELLKPLLPTDTSNTTEKKPQGRQYFWEDDGDHIGIKPTFRNLVRDEPRSRTKWQFGERFEYSAILDEPTPQSTTGGTA